MWAGGTCLPAAPSCGAVLGHKVVAKSWVAFAGSDVACGVAVHPVVPRTYKHPLRLCDKFAEMVTVEMDASREGRRVEKGGS